MTEAILDKFSEILTMTNPLNVGSFRRTLQQLKDRAVTVPENDHAEPIQRQYGNYLSSHILSQVGDKETEHCTAVLTGRYTFQDNFGFLCPAEVEKIDLNDTSHFWMEDEKQSQAIMSILAG